MIYIYSMQNHLFITWLFYTHIDTQRCSTRLARWIFRKNVIYAARIVCLYWKKPIIYLEKTNHLFRKNLWFITCVLFPSRESRAAALCVSVFIHAMNSGTNHSCKKTVYLRRELFLLTVSFCIILYTQGHTMLQHATRAMNFSKKCSIRQLCGTLPSLLLVLIVLISLLMLILAFLNSYLYLRLIFLKTNFVRQLCGTLPSLLLVFDF